MASLPIAAATAFLLLLQLLLLLVSEQAQGCSDFLVTPGASHDGRSAMIAYNADDVGLNGVLYHYPASNNNDHIHDTISIYEWDTGVSSTNSSSYQYLCNDWGRASMYM